MITQYGMSDEFGFINFESKTNAFLSDRLKGSYSEETARKIDAAMQKVISECYESAKTILSENRDVLDKLADVLYKKENITGDEFMAELRFLDEDKKETENQ